MVNIFLCQSVFIYEKRLWLKSFMLKSVLVPLDYAALLPDAAAGAGAVCKVEFYASNIESGAERDHET